MKLISLLNIRDIYLHTRPTHHGRKDIYHILDKAYALR